MALSLGIAPQLRIIDATDPEWDEWIESTPHDVYHTAPYHRVATFEGDGTPQLLVYGTREKFVAWPYLLNAIPDSRHGIGSPAFDVSSTYGYSGPLAHGCEPDDPLITEAWAAFRVVWRSQHVVSVFTRFHPILRNHLWFLDALGRVEPDGSPHGLVLTGETVSIDLTKSDDQIISEYPRTFRQEIASNRRKGLVTEFDEEWHKEWVETRYNWYLKYGVSPDHLRLRVQLLQRACDGLLAMAAGHAGNGKSLVHSDSLCGALRP